MRTDRKEIRAFTTYMLIAGGGGLDVYVLLFGAVGGLVRVRLRLVQVGGVFLDLVA